MLIQRAEFREIEVRLIFFALFFKNAVNFARNLPVVNRGKKNNSRKGCEEMTAYDKDEELIGVLMAISVVSKHMARKLIENLSTKKKGEERNAGRYQKRTS